MKQIVMNAKKRKQRARLPVNKVTAIHAVQIRAYPVAEVRGRGKAFEGLKKRNGTHHPTESSGGLDYTINYCRNQKKNEEVE
jgi:hypothetical protein